MPFDYDAPIYYPPMKPFHPSFPPVTAAPHNQCAFCSMYKDTPYRRSLCWTSSSPSGRCRNTAPTRTGLSAGRAVLLPESGQAQGDPAVYPGKAPLCEAVSMYASIPQRGG